MSSIQSKPGVGEVSIENPVPYASIHNDGGNITTHPTVSPKMKCFAWHMAYSLAGIKGKVPLPKELPQQSLWLGDYFFEVIDCLWLGDYFFEVLERCEV